jgi:hypothetical protein
MRIIQQLRMMYQRSRLDREPDEIVIQDYILQDYAEHAIYDTLSIRDLEQQALVPWYTRIKERLRWLPIDIETRLEVASEDVAEYERGRWDEKPSTWAYLLSFLHRKVTVRYYNWRRARKYKMGPLGRLRKRWRLFWGKEKLIDHRVRVR